MLKQELLLSCSSQSGECQSTQDLPPCSEATATLSVSPTLPDSSAVTPFLAFQQSSAVEALSRGLHKLGLCCFPGENSRSLYYNLPADWSDGCASSVLSRALWSKALIWPLLLKWFWCVWAEEELCVFAAGRISVPSLLLQWASPPNACLFTSSVSLSWFLAGCPPAPSPPTSTLAHFFHSFPTTPSSATSHFSPFAPSIRVGCIPATIVPQQGDSPPLDTP